MRARRQTSCRPSWPGSQLARNDEKVSGLMIQERYEQAQKPLRAQGRKEDAIELDW